MKTKEAVDHLIQQLKKDKIFRETYKANIAMAFYDQANASGLVTLVDDTLPFLNDKGAKKRNGSTVINEIANDAAENFLKQFCGEIKAPENEVQPKSISNHCDECSRELENGTVFCSADCVKHYHD